MCLLTSQLFSVDSTSALVKLSKGATGGPGKTVRTEKKETPQERLKRIMSKQLNKQSMFLFHSSVCTNEFEQCYPSLSPCMQ